MPIAPGEPMRRAESVGVVAFSPDGRVCLTGDSNQTAQLWDAATGKPLGAPMAHPGPVVAAAFSHDGKTVLTVTYSGPYIVTPVTSQGRTGEARVVRTDEARLWDAATGKPIAAPMLHRGPVRAVAFSADGRACLTGSDGGEARLWDAATGKPIAAPMIHRGPVHGGGLQSRREGDPYRKQRRE